MCDFSFNQTIHLTSSTFTDTISDVTKAAAPVLQVDLDKEPFLSFTDPSCGHYLGHRAGSFGINTVDTDYPYSTVDCTWILYTPDKNTESYYWGIHFLEHAAFLYILELDMEPSGCPNTNFQVRSVSVINS